MPSAAETIAEIDRAKADDAPDASSSEPSKHPPSAPRPRGRPRGKAAGPRQDNRRVALMDAAARLFADQGYRATTIRDIGGAVGMLPGSVYYHFPSKAALLLAVYREGVAGLTRRVDAAVAAAGNDRGDDGSGDGGDEERETDPWARLEAAAVAHLETVLDQSAYAKVMIRVLPDDAGDPAVAVELGRVRDDYENRLRRLVDDLELADHADAGWLRLMMLGALNWTKIWYREGGAPPATIARHFVRNLRQGVSP